MQEGAKKLSKSEVTLRPFVVLTALLAVCLAHAGRYELSIGPSGGGVTLSPGPPTYVAYTPAGTATSVNTGGGGTPGFADAKGVITTTFVWIPEFENDEPPPQVVVYENSSVHYHAKSYPSGVSGTCSNGLGHTATNNVDPITMPIPVPPYTTIIGYAGGGNCAGERAQIVAGGERIIVRCEPKVRVDVASGPIENVRVNYSVGVAWPEITYWGTVIVGGTDRIMTGQTVQATLGFRGVGWEPAGRIDATFHAWNPFGTLFYRWDPSQIPQTIPFPAGMFFRADPIWKYAVGDVDGKQNFTKVVATAVWDGIPIGQVSAVKPLTVYRPTHEMTITDGPGPTFVVDPGSGVTGLFLGGLYPNGSTEPGAKFDSIVLTPEWSASVHGWGYGCHAQRLKGSLEIFFQNSPSQPSDFSGAWHLDKSFPYVLDVASVTPPPTVFAANGSGPNASVDVPGHSALGFVGSDKAVEFDMHLMYLPGPNWPSPLLEYAPSWVPLVHSEWNWSGLDMHPTIGSESVVNAPPEANQHISWEAIKHGQL